MRKKLLLADDSVTIQRVIELTFADEPVDVVAVGDGAAAVERLEADPPDIVLADIGMPGLDGYGVATHVRQTPALAHIPVILLTGAFDPVDHARVRAGGCAGVLVKPFDPQMLVARVRNLLDGPKGERPADPVPPGDEAPPSATVSAAGSAEASGAAEARVAVVDEYFEQLDRAFATMGARKHDAGASAVAVRLETATADDVGAPIATDAAAGPTQAAADLPLRPDSRQPSSAEQPTAGAPSEVPVRQDLESPPPTLGDAFGALLALERGQPLPADASRFASLSIAAEVERIAERVVRELAPAIVSQVAERLVRDQTERPIPPSRDR